MSEGRLEPKSTQTTCRVLADYQAAYPEPIVVRAGEGLVVGQEDPEYPGWIWCTDRNGKGGWVPDDFIERTGGSAKARYDYAATELSACAGEELIITKEKGGWAWCINGCGQSGWVPVANLERENTN
jgi:uncharacterized protein YgiM (DUF1202 family)